MNHLAHLALAGADAEIVTGSFLGDFVKGVLRGQRPAAIELGIRLHRAIDAETARDEGMRRSALRFGPALRRLAPIFIDVLADHLLAQRFIQFHACELRAFTRSAYTKLSLHAAWLTEDATWLRTRLQQHDGLAANIDIEAVHRGMARIAQRLGREDVITASRLMLDAQYTDLSEDFLDYYPRLMAFAERWLEQAQKTSSGPTT